MGLKYHNIHVTSRFGKARGVIGRYPNEYESYVFTWDVPRMRRVHMLGVTRPLEVVWIRDGIVVAKKVLEPWTGTDNHIADMVIERKPRKDYTKP